MVRARRIAAELRRIDHPRQAVDMMIVEIALSLGNCTVISADSNQVTVLGLLVENWATAEE